MVNNSYNDQNAPLGTVSSGSTLSGTFFREDWPLNYFYGSDDSRRAIVS